MLRKLTFEEVKSEFTRRGYIMLDDVYTNARTKINYKCPKHPDKKLSILISALKRGDGCPYCAGCAKKTYDEVKEIFAQRGYELLVSKYENNSTKMMYRCPRHPKKVNSITLKDLQFGYGCPHCAGLAKPSFEEVRLEFEKRNYILLESKYVNTRTKMKYLCKKHPHEKLRITLNKFRTGQGCPLCADEFKKGEGNPNWKGGMEPLNHYLRDHQIVRRWKIETIRKHDSRCFVSQEKTNDLEVHHSIPFHIIRDEALKRADLDIKSFISDYSSSELELLMREFECIHSEHEGIPLKKELHQQFHAIYGYKTTMDDLLEFKEKYLTSKNTQSS